MADTAMALGDCEFHSEPNDNGMYVGRCREFPDLRTRPRKSRLDALDDIVTAVSAKLRKVDAAVAKQRGLR